MTTSDETKEKPLWLSIEENFLELDLQDLSGENREAAIQRIAGKLDNVGYNVSHHGGNLLQLRWAMDDMQKVGRPLMKDLSDAIAALSLEDVADQYIATGKLINDLAETWHELKKSERRPDVIQDRKSTRLNSSHGSISYAVFCLKKKTRLRKRRYSSTMCFSSSPVSSARKIIRSFPL